jgi:hypothetical protein
MHGTAEEIIQPALQGGLIEQAPSVAPLNEHVYVATRARITTGDRPEDAQPLASVTLRDAGDLVASLSQLIETRRRTARAGIRIRWSAVLDLS